MRHVVLHVIRCSAAYPACPGVVSGRSQEKLALPLPGAGLRSSANVKVRNQPVRVGLLLDETRSRTESNCVTVRWDGKQLEVE